VAPRKKASNKRSNQSAKIQFIKDPCHGYIFLDDLEKQIIDTRYFQRLRRIKQLSGSEFVYPGANHTRFEHSLGVKHLANKMTRSLNRDEDVEITEDEHIMVEIAGLLHDIGHGPFSHTFEALLEKKGKNHEDLSKWLIQKTIISDIISDQGFDPAKIAGLVHGSKTIKDKGFLNQIISSACDVDKMDFILRDSYHTGADYGKIDIMRILYTMGVFEGNLAVNYSALSSLEAFLIARVESFRTIYFHKVSRGSQLLLIRAMEKAEEELQLTDFKTPEEYAELDDFTVWTKLMNCEISKPIMQDLAQRRLLKVAFEREFMTRDDFLDSTISHKDHLKNLEQEIAQKANISPELVYIDIPTLPSVPYSHSVDLPAYEIPMFVRVGHKQKKEKVIIEKVSRIFQALIGMMYIFRVYTNKKNREKVKQAAESVFGKKTLSKELSF
jgi:hypothetical protein